MHLEAIDYPDSGHTVLHLKSPEGQIIRTATGDNVNSALVQMTQSLDRMVAFGKDAERVLALIPKLEVRHVEAKRR